MPNIKGKTIVGLDNSDTDFNAIGKVLGEKTHTLTIDEMPSHKHKLAFNTTGSGSGSGIPWNASDTLVGLDEIACAETGGGKAHNNIQPSFVLCYIIKAK